jgi:DNA-binding CsgD family transcriptional regulator
MMTPFDLERVTTSLVAASLGQQEWGDALETVAEATNSFGAVLLPVVGSLPLVSATRSMAQSFDVYASDGWIERDERYRGIKAFMHAGVVTDDDCMPSELRKRSGFYQDFLAKCGLSSFAGVRTGRGQNVWNLSLQRSHAQQNYTASEIDWLAALSNRLDAVVEASMALAMARGEAMLDAFQFSDRAALLLDRAGKVVRVNDAASLLLRGGDLQVAHGRILLNAPHAMEQLNRALKSLLWTRDSALVPPIVVAKRGPGKLLIYPMGLSGLTDSPLSAFHAILVIADTDATRSVHVSTLRRAFDFTEAEARLAAAMADGQDLATFATAKGITKETARNQLKALFAKTGVRRQAELTSLLSTLIAKR